VLKSEHNMAPLSLVAYTNYINLWNLNLNKKKKNTETALKANKNVLEVNTGKIKYIFISHLNSGQYIYIRPTNESSENVANLMYLKVRITNPLK
jgi:hypothetical protein